MAKKKTVRRVPQTGSPRMYGDGKPSAAAQAAGQKPVIASRTTATPAAPTARGAVNLAQEYHYVLGDLKRLGMIAAALFAALVVLGVVVR
ncbi:MAG: hypothetical protein N2439_16815 [Anaerolineae bacterium]|nr:hypothetical protein [Anaerolineae bacterium]